MCEKITDDNKKHIFNSIELYHGYKIDKIIYKNGNLKFPCESCSSGGQKKLFNCPENYYISGQYSWKQKNSDSIDGIGFICKKYIKTF